MCRRLRLQASQVDGAAADVLPASWARLRRRTALVGHGPGLSCGGKRPVQRAVHLGRQGEREGCGREWRRGLSPTGGLQLARRLWLRRLLCHGLQAAGWGHAALLLLPAPLLRLAVRLRRCSRERLVVRLRRLLAAKRRPQGGGRRLPPPPDRGAASSAALSAASAVAPSSRTSHSRAFHSSVSAIQCIPGRSCETGTVWKIYTIKGVQTVSDYAV